MDVWVVQTTGIVDSTWSTEQKALIRATVLEREGESAEYARLPLNAVTDYNDIEWISLEDGNES